MFPLRIVAILALAVAAGPAAHAARDPHWFDRRSTPGHSMRILSNGVDLLSARLDVIAAASETLYITAFSFFADPAGSDMKEAICARKREVPGLDVRILLDNIGSWGSRRLAESFRACGVPVVFFNPLRWDLKDFAYALHEKLMIADGKRMIIGGSGYGDIYADARRDGAVWYDLDLDVSGPTICRFHERFTESWRESRRLAIREHFQEDTGYESLSPGRERYLYGRDVARPCAQAEAGTSRALALYGNPYFEPGKKPLLDAYLDAMAASGGSIKLYSPYFIPHGAFSEGLLAARAKRIEVKIITNSPRSTDAGPMAVIGPFLTVRDLVRAGVGIYLWGGRNTMHRKGGVYGSRWAYFGSDNLDRRGQDYSSETVIFTDDPGAIEGLEAELDADIASSTRIDESYVDQYLSDQPEILKWLTRLVMPYL